MGMIGRENCSICSKNLYILYTLGKQKYSNKTLSYRATFRSTFMKMSIFLLYMWMCFLEGM